MATQVMPHLHPEFLTGAWGSGFIESYWDYDIAEELTKDAGLSRKTGGWLVSPCNRPMVQQVMNNGGLARIFNIYHSMLSEYRVIDIQEPGTIMNGDLIDSPRYYLMVLGMLAIEHGWFIPRKFRRWMKTNYASMGLNKDKEAQAKKALDEFTNGVSYKIGIISLLQTEWRAFLMNDVVRRERLAVDETGIPVVNTIWIRSRARMLHDNKVAMLLGSNKETPVNISQANALSHAAERLGSRSPIAPANGHKKDAKDTATKAPSTMPAWRQVLRKKDEVRPREFDNIPNACCV